MSLKHGSCLCHAIQYEVTGDPFNFNICHCVNCQKWGGSAFSSNPFFKPEQVVVTKGQEFLKDYVDSDTESGNSIIRQFCKECGSSVLVTDATRKEWIITDIGTLDDATDWSPKWENYPEKTKAWVTGIKLDA